MNGQWLGYLTNLQKDGKILDIQQSFVVLNLDLNGQSFEGRVMLFSLNNRNWMAAQVKINKKDFNQGKFTGKLSGFNPIREDTTIGSWEEKEFSNIPKTEIPETGEFGGDSRKKNAGESEINGRFKAGKTYEGKCYLRFYSSEKPYGYKDSDIKIYEKVESWEDFKKKIAEYNQDQKYIFRGQTGEKRENQWIQWKLRTSFHRTNRVDLFRYRDENIPELHRNINISSNRSYDLNNPLDYEALLTLAQHHGYPTPILDWTRCPYVAAYFAYENIAKNEAEQSKGYVRVFVFDTAKWVNGPDWIRRRTSKHKQAVKHLDCAFPSITYLEPSHEGNKRMLSQKAVCMFSSFDDIEGYVRYLENENKDEYLKIFDLPVRDRAKAMIDLHEMNITAAILFPDLDGICKALKEKHFYMLYLKKEWTRVTILKLRGAFIFRLQDAEELCQTKNNE